MHCYRLQISEGAWNLLWPPYTAPNLIKNRLKCDFPLNVGKLKVSAVTKLKIYMEIAVSICKNRQLMLQKIRRSLGLHSASILGPLKIS